MVTPLAQVEFDYDGKRIGFLANDRGVLDATQRYHAAAYMRGGPLAWTLRAPTPAVEAVVLHHTAGWYGTGLTARSGPADELAQLDHLAADHHQRFGIGPGYNVAVFPSGRVWAIGKHGTHRAHTKGRHPGSRQPWNVVGRGVVVFGDYESEPLTPHLQRGIRLAVREVRSWVGVRPAAPVYPHGLIPTVNAAGVRYSQGTACPGRHILAWLGTGGLDEPAAVDEYEVGWRDGWRAGHGVGLRAGSDIYTDATAAALRAVAKDLATPPVPPPAPGGAR